ncbi:MAG: helix-hairpin-helix domain-containing protein [Proteobacteria bacterium]|nr:helix-hairpin-helix domain-containing protein [Pseudomonadota bacterium]
MKERPKTGAFLIIAIAFLCVYLVKSYYITPGTLSPETKALSQKSNQPNAAGERLVYGLKIDINIATASELKLLAGIGSVLAARIVEERLVSGGFKSINDLERVKGLSPKRVKALAPYIMVAR